MQLRIHQYLRHLAVLLFLASPSWLHAAELANSSESTPYTKGIIALAIALGMGLAICGGAYGQSKMAAAAFEGTARNPEAKLTGTLLLSMVFVESLVLLAFVCMFQMVRAIF